MKTTVSHVLSILLVVIVSLLTIAKPAPLPTVISGHLTYETHDGYLEIKIEPPVKINHQNYRALYLDLGFEDTDVKQSFSNYIYDGEAGESNKMQLYTYNENYRFNLIEEVAQDVSFFDIVFYEKYLIIKLKEDLIEYDNYKVEEVALSTKSSSGWRFTVDIEHHAK